MSAAGTVASPCVKICRLREDGHCDGCWRTLDEVAGWLRFTDDERRAVLAQLPARRRAACGEDRVPER
ncbi:MAG: DUF1289 domain-containing protein [Gammaproteobacteria bacterium]